MTAWKQPAFWVTVVGIIAAFAAGGSTVVFGYWSLLPVAVAVLGLFAAVAWRRVGRNFGRITALAVTPNLVLIALPTILASAAISLTGAVYITAFVAVVIFWMKRASDERIALAWPCAIIPAAGLAIVLRPSHSTGTLSVAFFVLGCIVAARAVYLSASRSSAFASLIDGVGLFLVVSIVLWFAGVNGTQGRTAGLENSLTGGDRAVFPLTQSLAATPAMAAVYLAGVVPVLIVSRRYRLLRLVAAGCAVCIFVLSDSRVSLVGALFLVACVLLIPRLFRVAAPWLVGGSLIAPFVYGYIQSAFGQAVTAASAVAPWLIRPKEEVDTLNGRDQIWSRALNFYFDRVDWVHQMFGFGAYGNAESGASAYYNRGFTGFGDKRLVTPHSSALQILFDGGWLVAVVLAVTVVCMAWRLSRRTSPFDLAGLSVLVALSIVGISEVALSPSHAQPTWWVLVALGMIAFSAPLSVGSECCHCRHVVVDGLRHRQQAFRVGAT